MSHTFDAAPRAIRRSMHVQSGDRRGGVALLLLRGAAVSACVLACSGGDGGGAPDEPGPLDITVTTIQPRPPVQASSADDEATNVEPRDDQPTGADTSEGASADGEVEPAPEDGSTAVDPTGDAALRFATDVWPIFNGNCGPCHETLREGGHNVGSDDVEISFEAAVQNERLILRDLGAGAMPPGCFASVDGKGCVPDADIETIRAWYAAGSPR